MYGLGFRGKALGLGVRGWEFRWLVFQGGGLRGFKGLNSKP